mgnify:CR=1 FL=1
MMTALRSTILLAAIASTCPALGYAQDAEEDPTEGRGPQLLAEAQAHENEGRFALAAGRYLDLYGVMSEVNHPRAPVALWSAANALNELPGREEEAIDLLRRFLDESTALTDDERIRDWRSMAVTMIDELEARAPAEPSVQLDEPLGEPTAAPEEQSSGGGTSPVGPVLLGVGGAVLVAGLVVVGVAFAQDQDLRSRCPTQVGCDPAIPHDEVTATRTLGIAGDVMWIAGAAIALTGLVLTFVLDEGGDGGSGTALQLEGALGGALATLRWRFQ